MSKKLSKILHISSGSENQEPQNNQKAQEIQNEKKTNLKYGTYKSESFQLQKNILMASPAEQQYIVNQPQKRQQKNSIKFVDEQYFNIEEHTIEGRNEGTSQKTDISLLQQLNKIKFEGQTPKNPNPQLDEIRRSTKKNVLLQANFASESEDQNQQKLPKITLGWSKQTQKPIKNEDDDVIKEVEWDYKTSKEEFVYRRIKETQRLHLVLQREKSGVNFFLPEFNLLYRNDVRYILSCKKVLSTNFQCCLSFNNQQYSQTSPEFAGKIVGNFSNTIFNLNDARKKGIACTTKFKKEQSNNIVAPLCYEAYILNQNSWYQDLIGCDNVNFDIGLDEMYKVPLNRQHITHFRNKKPEYSEKLQAYMLNFAGRVSQGSVKNFIIEDSKSGREILMFGKGQGESFNLYISAPLTPLLALAIVIPHFATRVMLK